MKCVYPFPEDLEVKIAKPTGEYAHDNFPESRYAVDFLLEIGTPILAASDGIVIKIKSDSDKWGLDIKLTNKANYVYIGHDDGTYTEYLHLGKDQVVVEEGQEVNIGDLLGYTGLSGCMSEPHLHFNGFKVEGEKGISIPVEFEERN